MKIFKFKKFIRKIFKFKKSVKKIFKFKKFVKKIFKFTKSVKKISNSKKFVKKIFKFKKLVTKIQILPKQFPNHFQVAYAQGSTLDIHMRSVGHQARANRVMQQQQMQQTSSSATPQQWEILSQQIPPNGNLSPKPPTNNPMYKALLENFGLDIAKQFGEGKKNGIPDEKKDEEALDFSQSKESEISDPMKLFNAEMLAAAQKQSEAKFDPAMLAQRLMEQQFLAQFPQFAQSLQNLNAGNVPMNTLDMLNLMQFHHLMSLNFMNLAPPLIFGGGQLGNVLSPGEKI